jgi:RNA polymerase sigma factor (sigma-70 family)
MKLPKTVFGFKKTYHTEVELIKDCLNGKRVAQEALYQKYSPTMFGTCLRYMNDETKAEEIMIAGFLKVFNHLDKYKNEGSFEGWIRKIMINEALNELRKRKVWVEPIESANFVSAESYAVDNFAAEDLLKLIQALPTGYQTVFNLYAIEGYSHKEIADMLGISEGTSKSQLNRARAMLQKNISEQENFITDEREQY